MFCPRNHLETAGRVLICRTHLRIMRAHKSQRFPGAPPFNVFIEARKKSHLATNDGAAPPIPEVTKTHSLQRAGLDSASTSTSLRAGSNHRANRTNRLNCGCPRAGQNSAIFSRSNLEGQFGQRHGIYRRADRLGLQSSILPRFGVWLIRPVKAPALA